MPKRTIRVTIVAVKIDELLIVHTGAIEKARENAKVIHELRNKDGVVSKQGELAFWIVELPVKSADGFATVEIVEYTKQEVDKTLFQEARTRNKIDITGGGQCIQYVYDTEKPFSLKHVVIEFVGKFK